MAQDSILFKSFKPVVMMATSRFSAVPLHDPDTSNQNTAGDQHHPIAFSCVEVESGQPDEEEGLKTGVITNEHEDTTSTGKPDNEMMEMLLGGICLLACLGGMATLIYFGIERVQNANSYEYPPIETQCNVTMRRSEKCKCDWNRRRLRGGTNGNSGCKGIRYEYYAYVANCSETQMFRSSMEDCQKDPKRTLSLKKLDTNKVDVGDIATCYIEDCSTGEFVWPSDVDGYVHMEKKKGHWMIYPAAIILLSFCCFIACVGYLIRDK